jgi:hypothetical protein
VNPALFTICIGLLMAGSVYVRLGFKQPNEGRDGSIVMSYYGGFIIVGVGICGGSIELLASGDPLRQLAGALLLISSAAGAGWAITKWVHKLRHPKPPRHAAPHDPS